MSFVKNEKTQSGNKLSISEQNAGLRNVLLADDADGVAADTPESPPGKLAAALEWTSAREQALLDRIKEQTLTIARMESSGGENKGIPTHAYAANRSQQQLFAASP